MDGKLMEQFSFVKSDIELYDKKPVLMDTYKCDTFQLDNQMKTGETNCRGCDSLVQCCKMNVVIEMFARFQLGQIKPETFQTGLQLIIKDCKTQSEVMFVANSAFAR